MQGPGPVLGEGPAQMDAPVPGALGHAGAGFVLVSLSGRPGRRRLPGPQALGSPPIAGPVVAPETDAANRLLAERDRRSGLRRRFDLRDSDRTRATALGEPAGTGICLGDRPVTGGDGLLLDLVALSPGILLLVRSRGSPILGSLRSRGGRLSSPGCADPAVGECDRTAASCSLRAAGRHGLRRLRGPGPAAARESGRFPAASRRGRVPRPGSPGGVPEVRTLARRPSDQLKGIASHRARPWGGTIRRIGQVDLPTRR